MFSNVLDHFRSISYNCIVVYSNCSKSIHIVSSCDKSLKVSESQSFDKMCLMFLQVSSHRCHLPRLCTSMIFYDML